MPKTKLRLLAYAIIALWLILLAAKVIPSPIAPQPVTLLFTWLPNPPEQNVATYRLWEQPLGEPYAPWTLVVEVPATETWAKVLVPPDLAFAFVVTAVNDVAMESPQSNSVIWQPRGAKT